MSGKISKGEEGVGRSTSLPVVVRKKSRKKKKRINAKEGTRVTNELKVQESDQLEWVSSDEKASHHTCIRKNLKSSPRPSVNPVVDEGRVHKIRLHTAFPSLCPRSQDELCNPKPGQKKSIGLQSSSHIGVTNAQSVCVQPINIVKETAKQVPLLTAIKPENEKPEKERFFQAKFLYNPVFIYRHPADVAVLEKLSRPTNKYLHQAVLIMERALENHGQYESLEEKTGGKVVNRPEIVSLVKRYLKQENLEDEIRLNLCEDLLSRASMTKGKGKATLNIRIVNLREYWVEGLLRHEIGTHYLRSCNNKSQVWSSWKKRRELGLRHFNPTEEGLASLHSVLLRKEPCLWRCALLYYTAYQAAHLSFMELFRDLGKFVKDPHVRWDYCMRAKRGQKDTSEKGSFCKDQVYLEGALELLKHRQSIDFQLLVSLGKIAYQDVSRLEELADFSVTRIPGFMQDYGYYQKCLDRVALYNGLTEEVLAKV